MHDQKDNLPSLNSKTQPQYLRRVIRRRQAKNNQSFLFDHSLPSQYLYRGIFRGLHSAGQPLSIRADYHHPPSRFVIHLNAAALPAPEDLVGAVDHNSIFVNLLDPDQPSASVNAPVNSWEHDLQLHPADLSGQLTEDRPAFHFPKLEINLPTKPQTAHPSDRLAAIIQTAQIDQLEPPTLPEDIFAFFDLPENEEAAEPIELEPEESELVLLEEIAAPALQNPPAFAWSRFALPAGWPRALGAFVLLSFIIVLPLHAMNLVSELNFAQDQIVSSSQAGLGALESGAGAALVNDVSGATASFSQATKHFDQAQKTIEQLGLTTDLLLSVIPLAQKDYQSGKSLVKTGEEISIAGARIAEGFIAISNNLDPAPTARLALLSTYLNSARPHLEAAETLLDQVDPESLPEEYRPTLTELQANLPLLIGSLNEFVEFSDLLAVIMGGQGTKSYLVVFQNNTEIRPTGGFMGSFAEIDLHHGEIVRMNIPGGGTYDLQGSLRDQIAAPEPMQLLKARWEFQDANWFADFPTSARKILEFYQNSGGGNLDGVIAVNATYVADLIGLLGPVDMPDYGRTIDQENFVFEAQKIVELEYDLAENRPKAFIGDLAPILLERAVAKTGDDFLQILDFANRGLTERQLQIFFTDDELQRQVLNLGWGGQVKWTDGDYLMVVDTNLGGGKTDGVISQQIDLKVKIDDTGVITNTVSIARTHHGMPNNLFNNVNNVDYLRLYVPKGSQLLYASGFSIPDQSLFETPDSNWLMDNDLYYSQASQITDPDSGTDIFEESGKTVFGNWLQTKPGTTSVASFTYRLPFTLDTIDEADGFFAKVKNWLGFPATQNYTLTIQKQSGILERNYDVTIEPPGNLDLIWSSHQLSNLKFNNQIDQFLAILFDQPQ
ncbi:DUF4012 domain-containing protein [Patescibacteria group bacterium]|nr:DUF4012 domain-containing protein [Patescibacteria group bacterium]MBU1705537.1 DUF4012 domain-containing protein [Patescibacteria group bacterium]